MSRATIAAVLLASVAIPALGQDRPESLLPPGFEDTPAPAPAPAPQPTRAAAPTPTPRPADPGMPAEEPISDEGSEPSAPAAPVDLSRYELPEIAKHTLGRVGAVAPGNRSFPARSFARSGGKYLATLMRRLDAPVASRWVSIALRRALMSRVDTPAGINGADFAAERAWLLLRMGEPIAARAVVQDVDNENFTPMLLQIAMQVALGGADPEGICPIADAGAQALNERGWALAKAMCAGLAGEPNKAGQLLNAAKGRHNGNDVDTLLAEKVLGTGAKGRRAVTIEWQGVDRLSAWRWGLATATGVEVPDTLYRTVGSRVAYWAAVAPQLAPEKRLAFAELAAAQGVFSNAALVDLYAEIEEANAGASADVATARDLRNAYTAATPEDRLTALTTLWSGGHETVWAAADSARVRYARSILTARAAAGIEADNARADHADALIASMLSAGLTAHALEWRKVAKHGSDGAMMLAIADAEATADESHSELGTYRGSASRRKAQFALAALAGLGQLEDGVAASEARTLDVQIGGVNRWTQAMDRAARSGDAGTVALLAAVAMQTRSWDKVTPEALFHICAGFTAVGMADYARMIAVEAIARS